MIFKYNPTLHKNIIEYKNSKINLVPVNIAWLKQSGKSWDDYIEEKSNILYLSVLILENPHHLRKILNMAFEKYKDKIIFPCIIYSYAETKEGEKILNRLFTYQPGPWHSVLISDEDQLASILHLSR